MARVRTTVCKTATLCRWLASVGLGQFKEPFEDEGYDDLDKLQALSEDLLMDLGADVGLGPDDFKKLEEALTMDIFTPRIP